MILRPFLHSDPVAISYLLGCGGRAAAAVVDPVGDPSAYLGAAEATGMRIRYVVDTHLHADHLSAGRALAEAAGAEYVLHAEANAAYPFRGVRDGSWFPDLQGLVGRCRRRSGWAAAGKRQRPRHALEVACGRGLGGRGSGSRVASCQW